MCTLLFKQVLETMTESAARGAKRRRLEAEHTDLLGSVRREEVLTAVIGC